jgi:hypothetical protein
VPASAFTHLGVSGLRAPQIEQRHYATVTRLPRAWRRWSVQLVDEVRWTPTSAWRRHSNSPRRRWTEAGAQRLATRLVAEAYAESAPRKVEVIR